MFFNDNGLMTGFGYGAFVDTCSFGHKTNKLDISNGIYDEIKIDDNLNMSNSSSKEPWSLSTVFDALFQNNLEAGNFQNQNIPIQFLRFKRRKVGEFKWQIMKDIPFDKALENYKVLDYFIENAKDYEYSIVPLVQSTEGNGISDTITTNYVSLFITGKDSNGTIKNYPMRFDLNVGEIVLNQDRVFQKTLSSPYPSVLNGNGKYLTTSFSAELISKETENQSGEVDMKAENAYREEFEEFCSSGKPLLVRNHSFYVLGVLSDIKKSPFDQECAFGVWRFTMSVTETGNGKDLESLIKNNLTYDIQTK